MGCARQISPLHLRLALGAGLCELSTRCDDDERCVILVCGTHAAAPRKEAGRVLRARGVSRHAALLPCGSQIPWQDGDVPQAAFSRLRFPATAGSATPEGLPE